MKVTNIPVAKILQQANRRIYIEHLVEKAINGDL